MISPFAIALAAAITALVCLLIVVSFLWRYQLSFSQSETEQERKNRMKLEKRVAEFPEAWTNKKKYGSGSSFSHKEIFLTYLSFETKLGDYTNGQPEMLRADSPCLKSFPEESVARIKGLLFPAPTPNSENEVELEPGLKQHPFRTERRHAESSEPAIFPNERHYTAEEIVKLLGQESTRAAILHYILTSVLLHAVSIKGNLAKTLLPIPNRNAIESLNKLHELLKGEQMDMDLSQHISTFGLYYRTKEPDPIHIDNRNRYIDLCEILVDPYRADKSPEKAKEGKMQINEILDAAMLHGIHAIGHPLSCGVIEHRLAENAATPNVCCIKYEGEMEHFKTILKL